MIVACALGALEGALIFALIWALVPRRDSALVRLGRLDAHTRQAALPPAVPPGGPGAGTGGLRGRVESHLVRWLAGHGITFVTLRQDLALTGRTLESVLGWRLLTALGGFLAAAAATTVLPPLLGARLPPVSSALLALAAGAGMWFAPTAVVRREAAARRRDFREAVGAYLILVALEMAANSAPAEALPAAARLGEGWQMVLLRVTLQRARDGNRLAGEQGQWRALSELGERVGVAELAELATTISRVGRDGLQVRQTLVARAASMRLAALTQAQGQAAQRDQSMLMAQILAGVSCILLVTVPAVVLVLAL